MLVHILINMLVYKPGKHMKNDNGISNVSLMTPPHSATKMFAFFSLCYMCTKIQFSIAKCSETYIKYMHQNINCKPYITFA